MRVKYKLNKNAELEVFTGKEKVSFKINSIKAKADSLAFSLYTQGANGVRQLQWLEFKGKWQADKHNRLQFLIKQKVSPNRPLTLQGTWQVKNNTLVYTYQKSFPGSKIKQSHDLYFKGYWQINQKNRLTYILDSKNFSQFDFRAYLETPNLIGKRGQIKYRLGIGAKGDKLFKTQVVSLYGVWKFSRKAGLSLVLDYADGRSKAIDFGVFVRIDEKTKVTLGLINRQGKDIGISLILNKSFLSSDAQWFLELLSKENRPGFKWGVNLSW
ncbi:MAG: hypothetical protein KJ977_01690 [Candidatus Omnitrophica bacterium]|nr:hypothetical protein [Candidatus Omnitrophota bacterium]MBU2265729.1 hypothetical protein [Candidatus Omnitrophota bacterium]MBU2473930.1 hypothetical protein [Candidatus Omnitrophota bacterium]